MNFLYWIFWGLAYLPIRIFYPTKVINKKYFEYRGRAIFVCNHMSNMDIVLIKSHEHTMRYVLAKHTLFKNKFLAGIIRICGGIPINRQSVDISSIKTVLKLLKDNKQVIIFPEGTRRDNIDEAQDIKNGVAMFALKSSATIVPMALLYKPKFLRCNKILVGEPIDVTSFNEQGTNSEKYAKISEVVLQSIQNLRRNYIASFSPKKQLKIYKRLNKQILK